MQITNWDKGNKSKGKLGFCGLDGISVVIVICYDHS